MHTLQRKNNFLISNDIANWKHKLITALKVATGTNHIPLNDNANVCIHPKTGDTWSNEIVSNPGSKLLTMLPDIIIFKVPDGELTNKITKTKNAKNK